MDIRNIGNTSLSNLQPVKATEIDQSEKAQVGAPEAEGPRQMPPEWDRFDFSRIGTARDVRSPELQFAQQALRSLPETDTERLTDIKARIADGYYSRPGVMDDVAGRLASLFDE